MLAGCLASVTVHAVEMKFKCEELSGDGLFAETFFDVN